MGFGETITSVIAIIAVFGSIFGGAVYLVNRVLSHKRSMRQAELDAQVRLSGVSTAAPSDELLRAMAQELRTQRQMIESLLERQAAQKVPVPANLAPAAEPQTEVYAPVPPQPLRA
jgi:hypothetical protein